MRLLLLIPFFAVLGCAQTIPANVTRDDNIGLSLVSGRTTPQFVDPVSSVQATPMAVIRDGRFHVMIKTFVQRKDLNFPKISSAWSQGQEFVYEKIDRQRWGRGRVEVGKIPLPYKDFRSFAETGLDVQLSGPRGRYEVHIEKESFQDVLLRMRPILIPD